MGKITHLSHWASAGPHKIFTAYGTSITAVTLV